MSDEYRFYGELAEWWPLISPPQDYVEEAAYLAGVFRYAGVASGEILELGSGGGSNAVHLTATYAMTLTDLSDAMLDVSRRLNPGCPHLQGDMRDLRLGRTFDGVLAHDGIDYMASETDLRRAVDTAFVHCRPGGVAVFVPDRVAETFEPDTDHGGSDGDDGRSVRFLEWTWDPDPFDTWAETDYVFVLRDAKGATRVVHETHRFGVFGREVWLRVLAEAGFAADRLVEETTEDRTPRDVFVGRRQ